MAEYYEMTVAGLKRRLKLCPISDTLEIASFILFSDVELTEACARALKEKMPPCDYILTAESKGIPLAYALSRQTGIPYVVARKSIKAYMSDVFSAKEKSITTPEEQTLYLDGEKAAWLKDKRVLLLDDVISTGASLHAMEVLTEAAGGKIVGRAAILAEGDASKRTDLIFLEPLPLFFKDTKNRSPGAK